jgi:SMC interacting uncharacterized protein involved in chromosome segregation
MSERRSEDHDYVERMDTSHASDPTAYWQELAQALAAQVAELQALLEQRTSERDGAVSSMGVAVQERDAEIAHLRKQNERLNRSIVEHHNIAYLSEDAIKESIGGPCQICVRAQAALADEESEAR